MNDKIEEHIKESIKGLANLKCVDGAMYFGSVEVPCSGRETGECCHNEQTHEEAITELGEYVRKIQLKLIKIINDEIKSINNL